MAKLCGAAYKGLTPEEKKYWTDLAIADRCRYDREYAAETAANGGKPLPFKTKRPKNRNRGG